MKDFVIKKFTEMKKAYLNGAAHSYGFTLAEITVVLIVMTAIILLAGRMALSDRQNEYDAKFNKISSNISSNINADLISKTGFRFPDYDNNNDDFQDAVVKNLNNQECTDCWQYTLENPDKWTFYKLKDGSVIAVNKESTDVWIDVNGTKGPNTEGKDVREYNHPSERTTLASAHITPNEPDGPNPPPDEPTHCLCDGNKAIGYTFNSDDFKYTCVATGSDSCDYQKACVDNIPKPMYKHGANEVKPALNDCVWSATCPTSGNRKGEAVFANNTWDCPCRNKAKTVDSTVDKAVQNSESCEWSYICKNSEKRDPIENATAVTCLCKNRDESNHETSTEKTVSWSLSDNCDWSCSNSRTNPGDNYHTYYEQKTNCDWDKK
ncbi:hypothetical protein IJS77_01095, partial [bacterium]|nr:hypothetical protein [bacterium]